MMADSRKPAKDHIVGDEPQLDERVVHVDRVARVVKGGRRFHFRALVAVGDHAGQIGIGIAKGLDVTAAVSKAVDSAKKSMIKINLYNETIPHETEGRTAGAHIFIKPAGSGTGLIAGGVVRVILELAGVRNALSKSLGSTNKINAAYATVAALLSVEDSSKWVTRRYAKKRSDDKTQVSPKQQSKAKVARKS